MSYKLLTVVYFDIINIIIIIIIAIIILIIKTCTSTPNIKNVSFEVTCKPMWAGHTCKFRFINVICNYCTSHYNK